MQILIVVLVIGTTIWVARDAESLMGGIPKAKRKAMGWWGPAEWAIGCLLLWILVFPAYLLKRSKYRHVRFQLSVEEAKKRIAERKAATVKDDGVAEG